MAVNRFPIRDGTGWRLVCIFWLLVATARAGVFYVSDTSDSLKPVSLRGAVIRGTQNGTNTIILANNPLSPGLHRKNIPRVYRLTRTSTNDLDGRMGNLVVNHGNLTIQGAGPGVVIDASQLHDRIFKVGPQATLRLINVTLTGGNPDGLFFSTNGPAGYVINNSPNAGLGGAICNQGNLFLADCLLTNNSSAFGGDPQSDSEGAGNPLSDGGALYNLGTAILVNCQLAGNKCGDGGLGGADGGNGGAIYNEFSGVCLLTDCQIVGNRAGDGAWASDRLIDGGWGGCGGGIFNDNGTLCLTNCSIVNNRAGRGMDGAAVVINGYVLVGSGGWGGDGGGICNINYGKLLSLKSCTVFSNVCGDGGNSAFTTNIANDSIAGDGGNGGSGGGKQLWPGQLRILYVRE